MSPDQAYTHFVIFEYMHITIKTGVCSVRIMDHLSMCMALQRNHISNIVLTDD